MTTFWLPVGKSPRKVAEEAAEENAGAAGVQLDQDTCREIDRVLDGVI